MRVRLVLHQSHGTHCTQKKTKHVHTSPNHVIVSSPNVLSKVHHSLQATVSYIFCPLMLSNFWAINGASMSLAVPLRYFFGSFGSAKLSFQSAHQHSTCSLVHTKLFCKLKKNIQQVHLQLMTLTSDCHEPVKVRQVYNVVTNNIESPRHSPQQFLGHPISEYHHMVVFWKVLLKSLIPQFPTALMVSFRNVNCTMRKFCINRNNETTNIKKA